MISAAPSAHLQNMLSGRSYQPLFHFCAEVLDQVFGLDSSVPIAVLHVILRNAPHGLLVYGRRQDLSARRFGQTYERDFGVVKIRDRVIGKLRFLVPEVDAGWCEVYLIDADRSYGLWSGRNSV